MKTIPASDLKTYVGNSSLVDVALKADGDTLATGFNYMADMSADGTDVFNLPASPAVGDVVRVKAPVTALLQELQEFKDKVLTSLMVNSLLILYRHLLLSNWLTLLQTLGSILI